jgi:hypothetical protein
MIPHDSFYSKPFRRCGKGTKKKYENDTKGKKQIEYTKKMLQFPSLFCGLI